MIILTISKQHTGGATERKDRPEWMTDSTSVDPALFPLFEEPCVREVRQVGSFQSRSCWRSQNVLGKTKFHLPVCIVLANARWCVAKCAIPFGPICARVILFSTIANYCHSQKAVNKSLSCAARDLPFTDSESITSYASDLAGCQNSNSVPGMA